MIKFCVDNLIQIKRKNKSKSKRSQAKSLIFLLIIIINILIQLPTASTSWAQSKNKCFDVFNNSNINLAFEKDLISSNGSKISAEITAKELLDHTIQSINRVTEFQFIRTTAENMGIRVWLFGGTASSFVHYVKWDLSQRRGQSHLQKDRFDFDYTNIFRSTQDLDLVIDASPDVAQAFQKIIAERYPHFLGAKANWEVRTLFHRMGKEGSLGFKEALLNDSDFNNQNTDSNSLGMIELTFNKNQMDEPVIRDLKNWDAPNKSVFLEDVLKNKISFFRSLNHFSTSRAKAGENPEILSVIRLLVKAFQYELNFSSNEFEEMKQIVNDFDGKKIKNSAALRRIHDTAKKLVMHAVNIEYAINKLDELGLRKKLIEMGNINEINSDAWWLNREPLRAMLIGTGIGKTAAELQINVVAHETNNFLAYESITRAHSGEPNVFISRKHAVGETAAFGDGFYTKIGKLGARGTGLTIRFVVNPKARSGIDFIIADDYVIFKNKKALTVIQESLNLNLNDLLKLAEANDALGVDTSDLALIEKLKRKINASIINQELNKLLDSKLESDHARLIKILISFQNSSVGKLISNDVLVSVAKSVFERVSIKAQSVKEEEVIQYIKTIGPILTTLSSLDILKSDSFFNYLDMIIRTPANNYSLRIEAAFERLLVIENIHQFLQFKTAFKEDELKDLVLSVWQWEKSSDPRKRNFVITWNKKWSYAIQSSDISTLQSFVDSSLFEINHKNISQVSILQLAAYYNNQTTLNWLILMSKFDFNAKNNHGFTEVEQLKLSGYSQLAEKIENLRPDIKAQKITVRERNFDLKTELYPDGIPIIDFIRIEPGSFLRGFDKQTDLKYLTTISKPFEFMSVDVTQGLYRTVGELIKANLSNNEYSDLNISPSFIMGEMRPVEGVSYDDVTLWKNGLNELSQRAEPQIQEKLVSLFPGHKLGAKYGRPTEAQWEYVARLGGFAESTFSFGPDENILGDYAIFNQNSNYLTQPVGSKKPVFYNGQPIYDLHGNVMVAMEDWFSSEIHGGVDPLGPNSGSKRVYRGGNWYSVSLFLKTNFRHSMKPNERASNAGFRLIRFF